MMMIAITFQAVTKVIVAVLVGAMCCSSIPNSATTMRDFSFLISNVLLPALTITNTARSVDMNMLIRCSVLLIFGVLVILLGIGCAIVMDYMLFGVKKEKTGIPVELCKDVRLDLLFNDASEEAAAPANAAKAKKGARKKKDGTPYAAVILSRKLRDLGIGGRDIVAALEVPSVEVQEYPFYYWGAWVACSIQNAVTLPLSLLQSLSDSLPWLNFAEGTAYIFVFSITATLYLWAAGPVYVEKAIKESTKRRLIREIIIKHKRMVGRSDAVTQTDISYVISHDPLKGGELREEADRHPRPSTTVGTFTRAAATARTADAAATAAATSPRRQRERLESKEADIHIPPRSRETVAVPVSGRRSERSGSHTVATSRATSPPPEGELAHADSAEQTDYQAWSPNTARRFCFPEIGCAEQMPYDWETAGYIRVKYADELRDADGPSALSKATHAAKQLCIRLAMNIPFMSIVLGIVIGVIPFLRNLFFNGGPLEMITDAVTLVGQGNIPAALLLLGANLVGSTAQSSTAPAAVRMRDSEQNTDFPLVPAADTELLGADGTYADWYRTSHERMEFDEHASFSLQTALREQAAERMASARLAAAGAARHGNGGEEGQGGGESSAGPSISRGGRGSRKKSTAVTSSTAAAVVTADDLAAAGPPDDDEDEEGSAVKKDAGFMAEVHRALSLHGVKKRFVWGVITERLVVTPGIGFAILMALIKVMPFIFGGVGNMDRTLLVVLFMELAAPTAINSALLFNQRQYMTYQWAKMLFFQYVLCTLTLVVWASVGLVFVENHT